MKELLQIDISYVYAFLGEATLSFTFVLYILLARVLGPQQFGIFASAAALGGILSLFIQFGLPSLLNREVAVHPLEGSKNALNFITIQFINSLVVLLLVFPLSIKLGFEGSSIVICYLAVLAEIFRSIKMTFRGILRGLAMFRIETLSVSIERIATILLTSLTLFLSGDLILIVGTIVLCRAVDVLGLFLYLNQKLNLISKINVRKFNKILKSAYPFALSGVLWILYYQIDLVMLKAFSFPEEAGFYSAAYRLIEIFSALPRVIFYVSFTKLTQCYANQPEKLPQETYRTISLLLIIIVPVLLIAGFLQKILVQILYGEAFIPTTQALSLLLPSISIAAFSTLARELLKATRCEKQIPLFLFATVLLNILMNLILIPKMGSWGAAISTLTSEVTLFALSMYFVNRLPYRKLGPTIFLIGILTLLATATPSFILSGMPILIAAVLMSIAIFAIYILMKRAFNHRQTYVSTEG